MAVSMQLPHESAGAAKGALLHARGVARSPPFTHVEYEDQPAFAASLCHAVVILEPVRSDLGAVIAGRDCRGNAQFDHRVIQKFMSTPRDIVSPRDTSLQDSLSDEQQGNKKAVTATALCTHPSGDYDRNHIPASASRALCSRIHWRERRHLTMSPWQSSSMRPRRTRICSRSKPASTSSHSIVVRNS
jgi:hypothetical protein